MPKSKLLPSLFTLLTLVGLSVWSIRLMEPPSALPADAPGQDFSATRAMQHVWQIAREPHSVGTPAHATVRAYLLGQMRRLNLQPIVQETTIASRDSSRVGYVYNLLGRLRGRDSSRAVLLMAHYDSQPNARGAADDGAGVAALLETARALQQGPPLQHDVMLLLTDGEEAGLHGAQAFMRHPWVKNVGLVVNLEARGTRGPSMTFELSSQNGWLVDAFAQAAPYPLASSLMYEIYRRLPNNTDFTVFRTAGYSGFNSAIIDGFINYHKLTDSPDRLDPGSLQHHGSNALALTRYVGNQPLTQTKAADQVFFNPVGYAFVHYRPGLNWFWLALLTLLLIVTVRTGMRQQLLTLGQSLAGAGLYTLMIVLVVGLCWGINFLVLCSLPYVHSFNGTYGSDRFLVAYSLLTVGLFGLLCRLALRWLRPFSLVTGAYGLFFGLVVLSVITLPSASYLFLFPLLASLLGTWLILRLKLFPTEDKPAYGLLLVAAALPALWMLVPLVRLLFVTFDLQLPMASMAMLLLLLGFLLPAGLSIDRSLRWRGWSVVPLVALSLGVLLTGWAIRRETPDADQPLHSQVNYYVDADSRRAFWSSDFLTTDPWNRQFFTNATSGPFTELYPTAKRERLKASTTAIALSAPTAGVLSDSSTRAGRVLRLRLKSVRGAANFSLILLTKNPSDVLALSLNNEPVRPKPQPVPQGTAFTTMVSGLPVSKEVALIVRIRPGAPLTLLLYDESVGLPDVLIKIPRPAYVVPEQGSSSNHTIVRKAFQF